MSNPTLLEKILSMYPQTPNPMRVVVPLPDLIRYVSDLIRYVSDHLRYAQVRNCDATIDGCRFKPGEWDHKLDEQIALMDRQQPLPLEPVDFVCRDPE